MNYSGLKYTLVYFFFFLKVLVLVIKFKLRTKIYKKSISFGQWKGVCVCVVVFEMGSCYVAQAALEFSLLLPQLKLPTHLTK